MTGSEVIQMILNDLGVKAPTFAKSIGVNYQRILDIQNGKVQKISSKLAEIIIEKYPQYSYTWLLTGIGEKDTASMKPQLYYGGENEQTDAHNENANAAIPNAERLFDLLEAKEKSLAKAQEHIDKLLNIISKLTTK